MKSFRFFLLFSLVPLFSGAQIFFSKTSSFSIFSESPVENIDAVNTAAKVVLNTATGDVQVRVPIRSFKFKKPLMEEHFNENYMESEKFPNAEFKGKINEKVDYKKDGEYKVTVTGKLTIHGVVKERTIEGKITIKGDEITISTTFMVHIADHNIEIPSVVVKNIAEDVKVTVSSVLEPFKKK